MRSRRGLASVACAVMLAVASWPIWQGRSGRSNRVWLGLLAGSCSVIGPAIVLRSMVVHGAVWSALVVNAAGTVGLLVLNALPAALWWARLRQPLDVTGAAPAA